MSLALVSLNGLLPSEFARQPRTLNELDRWKATEFLLYTGPIVLRNVLSYEAYEHFIAFSVSVSIMLQSNERKRTENLPYARDLMKYFVGKCQDIYGETFTVYNVHNLLHLHEDVGFFGCSLNEISCFPFENNLEHLKNLVRNANNPVFQICKRETELEQSGMNKNKKKLFTKVSCAQKDSCFLLADDSVAFVKVKRADGSFECDVIRPQYMDSVYKRPVDSNVFGLRTQS